MNNSLGSWKLLFSLSCTYIAANTSQPPIRIQFGVSLVGFSGDFDVSPADFVPNLEDEVNIFILVWSNSYVQLILGSFPHTGKCRRFTENNLPSNTNVCNVYQIIQTMKLYIHCTYSSLFSCPELFRRNGQLQYRYHCTVTSFPAKDSNANLSLEDLSALLHSASKTIQSRSRPGLRFASNFTFQGTVYTTSL